MSERAARVLEAVVASVDRARLEALLGEAAAPARSAAGGVEAELAARLVLADLLDEAILGARPGEPSFPLRALLGEIGAALATDEGFALAALLNVFFRVECEEETRMRVGLEASRAYYRFARARGMKREAIAASSPLLAQLLSTQLERVRLESVDHERLFDGTAHERAAGSDHGSAGLQSAASFLCRVSANGVVRVKASVVT